ncbi:MAG: SCO1664 family protein [Anaerolineales bacterium]|nr:SCO1664 family protein [Anaerolineales bacterium]
MSNPASVDTILATLSSGAIHLEGRFLWGSNYTFLVRVAGDRGELKAVYKPLRGEMPLWDFPPGTLAAREVAAYLTSQALGWDFVPPTVLRADGPAGPGSLQLFVDADPEHHYFTFTAEEKGHLGPAVAFDALVNNADRKAGHVLLAPDGHLWLIDHGLCFHAEDKLRTVIWDFAGEPIPESLLQDVRRFLERLSGDGELRTRFRALLDGDEVLAMAARAERLLSQRRFPYPGPGRPYPWPLV